MIEWYEHKLNPVKILRIGIIKNLRDIPKIKNATNTSYMYIKIMDMNTLIFSMIIDYNYDDTFYIHHVEHDTTLLKNTLEGLMILFPVLTKFPIHIEDKSHGI
jgi:hypothetical protein